MRMNVHGHRPVLGYFVLASLLLHALVVNFWHGTPPAGPQAQNTFQVTVLARRGNATSTPDSGSQPPRVNKAQPATAPAANTAPKHGHITGNPVNSTQILTRISPDALPQAREKTPDNRPALQAAGTTAQQDDPAPAKPARSTTPDTGRDGQHMQLLARSGASSHGQHELSSSARHNRVMAALQKALFPHFNYPPLARRRGWQGSVNVGLRVEADGNLTRIRLVKSSGHALLDRAAIRNITELRSLPGAAQWLGDDDMDVILPVLYRLVD